MFQPSGDLSTNTSVADPHEVAQSASSKLLAPAQERQPHQIEHISGDLAIIGNAEDGGWTERSRDNVGYFTSVATSADDGDHWRLGSMAGPERSGG